MRCPVSPRRLRRPRGCVTGLLALRGAAPKPTPWVLVHLLHVGHVEQSCRHGTGMLRRHPWYLVRFAHRVLSENTLTIMPPKPEHKTRPGTQETRARGETGESCLSFSPRKGNYPVGLETPWWALCSEPWVWASLPLLPWGLTWSQEMSSGPDRQWGKWCLPRGVDGIREQLKNLQSFLLNLFFLICFFHGFSNFSCHPFQDEKNHLRSAHFIFFFFLFFYSSV